MRDGPAGLTDRIADLIKPRFGRRLAVVSGHGIRDFFFLNSEANCMRLVPALRVAACEERYDIVLSFNEEGLPVFATVEMAALFESCLGVTQFREDDLKDGERELLLDDKPEKGDVDDNETPVQSFTQDVASGTDTSALANFLESIENVCATGLSVFAVFEEPEDILLFERLSSHLQRRRIVRLLSAIAGFNNSRVILVVKPGCRDMLLEVIERGDSTDLIREYHEIGPASRNELLQFLDHSNIAQRLHGDRELIAREWYSSKRYLYHLIEALAGLPSDAKRIEDVLRISGQRESLEAVVKELDALVGLDEVKERLKTLLNTMAPTDGARRYYVSTHMMFLGNPGTGKTEVARLVARYLVAAGVRTSPRCIEVSRSDLASEYNRGECIEKMNRAINDAMGGVLFVDEAYQMVSNEWMKEALETLMKAMEDHRDSITVIFAGYEDQMRNLWRANQGFRSRIREKNQIVFPDYEPADLAEMFNRKIASHTSGTVPPSVKIAAREFIKYEARRGRFGNGRGVRNLVDTVLENRANAGGGNLTPEMIPAPNRLNPAESDQLVSSLQKDFVGIGSLLSYLEMARNLAEQCQDDADGADILKHLHCKLVGPSGSGKTSIARRFPTIMHAMGILSRDDLFVELNPIVDFTAEFVGELEGIVADKFDEAQGGVLCISHADHLLDSPRGRHILNLLSHHVSSASYNGTIVVFTGFRERLDDVTSFAAPLRENLKQIVIDLPPESLEDLFLRRVKSEGYSLNEEATNQLRIEINNLYHTPGFAYGRTIIELARSAISNSKTRLGSKALSAKKEIHETDLAAAAPERPNIDELLEKVDTDFVGLANAKQSIKRFATKVLASASVGNVPPRPPRALFLGNPGTGKSSFAREYARLLHAIGCTQSEVFVETRGTELKGSVIGKGQENVVRAFRDAIGGTLFIDEIYALNNNGRLGDAFAADVVNTIVGQTELPANSRTAVILAGYPTETLAWLQSNPGLASRFPIQIYFEDYKDTGDCIEIFVRAFLKRDRKHHPGLGDPRVPLALKRAIGQVVNRNQEIARRSPSEVLMGHEIVGRRFDNARTIHQLVETVQNAIDDRIMDLPREERREASGITFADVVKGLEAWCQYMQISFASPDQLVE